MAAPTNTARRPRRQRLTDAIVRDLNPTPPRIVYDIDQRGFGVRLSPTSRSWILGYSLNRRERRVTIGHFPTWNAKQARARAMELRRLVDIGQDPLQQRQAERAAPDMGELADLYLEQAKHKRSLADDRSMLTKIILPKWRARPVNSITSDDVEALHLALSKKTPIRANRVLSLLSTIFALAVRRKMRVDNPCKGCQRNAENRRTRDLAPAELQRLLEVLSTWPCQISANAIRLLLLTGGRRQEILGASWSEFDIERRLWQKPASRCKNGRAHVLWLSDECLAVLSALPHHANTNLLFANGRRRPWSEIPQWGAIRRAAGLDGPDPVRLHDLRHVVASKLASSGVPLLVIGRILNHQSPSSTARYSHINDVAAQNAVSLLGRTISGIAAD